MISRGFCHAVFMLTRSAPTKEGYNFAEWIESIYDEPTIWGSMLDILGAAQFLIDNGLASEDKKGIAIDQSLYECGHAATEDTLIGIAKILLARSPPLWLNVVVGKGFFRPDLIPIEDANKLKWLDTHLASILSEISRQRLQNASYRQLLGKLGEAVVVESEKQKGSVVSHVALINDGFGYDVESQKDGFTLRLEVKASVPDTQYRVFLSKNESRVANDNIDEWYLVQIIMRSDVFLPNVRVDKSHIVSARQISARRVTQHLLKDTETCKWIKSVELSIPSNEWEEYELALSSSWAINPKEI